MGNGNDDRPHPPARDMTKVKERDGWAVRSGAAFALRVPETHCARHDSVPVQARRALFFANRAHINDTDHFILR